MPHIRNEVQSVRKAAANSVVNIIPAKLPTTAHTQRAFGISVVGARARTEPTLSLNMVQHGRTIDPPLQGYFACEYWELRLRQSANTRLPASIPPRIKLFSMEKHGESIGSLATTGDILSCY